MDDDEDDEDDEGGRNGRNGRNGTSLRVRDSGVNPNPPLSRGLCIPPSFPLHLLPY
jgi:hypothetical protein